MGEISLSLSTLFEQTFGYKTTAFEPEFGDENSSKQIQRKEQGAGGSPYYTNDAFGVEYYMPVTLVYPDTTTSGSPPPGNTPAASDKQFVTRKKWSLPYPIVSLKSKKTIVETAMTERGGTLKELINIKDYEILVRGFIVGTTEDYPERDVTTLRTIYEQNTAISMQCPLTDIFLLRPDRSGSDQVVISELIIKENVAVKNICAYEMKLVSDEPFNLISIE